MAAYPPEIEANESVLTEGGTRIATWRIDGIVFQQVRFEGHDLLLFPSGVSMVNAAMNTQKALDRFRISHVFFAGIAGGIITWLAAKLVRAPLAFGRAVFIATLASVPRILGLIGVAVQGALVNPDTITSPFSASLGPARFLDARTADPAVLAMAGSIDVFTLWNIVITAIGVSVIAKTSGSTGWIVSVIAWALSVILTLLPVLLA
jgi:hypothetical protein